MSIVEVDTADIHDWDSFHAVFSDAFGFPNFYGRNMDAWVDCLTYLDDPAAGMTRVHALAGGVVTLKLFGVTEFAARCPRLRGAYRMRGFRELAASRIRARTCARFGLL